MIIKRFCGLANASREKVGPLSTFRANYHGARRSESIIQRARCRRGHKRPSTRAAPAPRRSSAQPRPTSLITEALSAGAEPAVRSRSTDPIASTCAAFKFVERLTRLMPSDPDNSGSIFIDKSRAKINDGGGGDVNLDRSRLKRPGRRAPFRDLLDDASRCHRGWAFRVPSTVVRMQEFQRPLRRSRTSLTCTGSHSEI